MRLVELQFELARAQMMRASVAGIFPRILSLTFDAMDDIGKMFSCRATFTFGADYMTQFTLDDPADLSGDWQQRFDSAVFDSNQMWMQ